MLASKNRIDMREFISVSFLKKISQSAGFEPTREDPI